MWGAWLQTFIYEWLNVSCFTVVSVFLDKLISDASARSVIREALKKIRPCCLKTVPGFLLADTAVWTIMEAMNKLLAWRGVRKVNNSLTYLFFHNCCFHHEWILWFKGRITLVYDCGKACQGKFNSLWVNKWHTSCSNSKPAWEK